MNQCSACGLDFATETIFAKHQIGEYPQTGPGFWLDRVRAGLITIDEEWKPTAKFGRRCLEEEELVAAGWTTDRNGRWVAPGEVRSEARLENAVERVNL